MAGRGVQIRTVVLAREGIDMVRDEIRHVRKIRLLEGKGREGERPRHVLADRAEHALELLERLMLVFVDRLLLRISAKMDHLPQRIQHRPIERKSVVEGKRGAVRVGYGG